MVHVLGWCRCTVTCSIGLDGLIRHDWKYCWLIWCERKILFVDWKSMTYKPNKYKRTGLAGTSLYQVTCKIISQFSVLKRDPYMLVLDPWTEMGLIQTNKKEVNRLIMSSKKYQNRAKEGSSWALNNIKYWWMQRSQTKLAVLRTFFFT